MIRPSALASVVLLGIAMSLASAAERRDDAPAPAPFKRIATLEEAGGCGVSFSADGRRLLTTGKAEAQVWDTATWQPVGERMEHGPGLHMAALDANGSTVLTVGSLTDGNGKIISGEAKAWDGRTGRPMMPPIHHGDQPTSWAAISPDGKLVATCFEQDRRVRVWDVPTGRERIVLDHKHRVGTVQFDPTGRTLVTMGAENTVWDVHSWHIQRRYPGTVASGPPAPAFSPDGKRMVISTDTTFEVYDFASGRKVCDNGAHFLHIDDYMSTVAISPNCQFVATTSTDAGAVWDASTGEPVLTGLEAYFGVPAFSPDGKWVIFNSPVDKVIWNVRTRQRVGLDRDLSPEAACFSPDGKTLAVGTNRESTAIFRIINSP